MINNWNLGTIQSFIADQVEESLTLDYKAADALQKTDAKKKEISKDISAMANSAGGIIIYGIKEFADSSRKHLPEKIDPVKRSEISKEWLDQILNANIQPKIPGVIVTPVTVDDTLGTVIYVVQIPQSNTAHQANDKRYYRRYNFECIAMDDYEIRDIMGRLKHPDLTLEISLVRTLMEENKSQLIPASFLTPAKQAEPKTWHQYDLKIYILNQGNVIANYVNYYLEIPTVILHKDEQYLPISETRKNYKTFYSENTIRDVVDIQTIGFKSFNKYGPSRFDPVLPGTKSRSKNIRLRDDFMHDDFELFWTIYADNADVKNGSISSDELVRNLKFGKES